MMGIAIGTSGYGYDEWRGSLYPADLPREDYLRYYSMFFPFVEIDSSYYRMPEAWRLEQAAERVPSDFLFSIKAHKSLTHECERGWPALAAEFSAALRPPAFRRRLAGVLLQFPHRFDYTDANRMYLGELTRELSEFPLFLEFRNDQWNRPAVLEESAKRGIGLVAVDSPDLPTLPDRSFPITSDVGYLRFHGRNAAAWWSGTQDARYDYSYPDAELREWVGRVMDAEKRTRLVLVSFNNHGGGNSVKDARRFKALIDASRPRLPPQDEGPSR